MSRKELTAERKKKYILDSASDLMSNFLYYDRKECEYLGPGDIEKAIDEGVVCVEEILAIFEHNLRSR